MILAEINSYDKFTDQALLILLPTAIICISLFFVQLYRYFEQKLFLWLSLLYFIRSLQLLIMLGPFPKGSSDIDNYYTIMAMFCALFTSFIAEVYLYILLLPKLKSLKAHHLKKQHGGHNND